MERTRIVSVRDLRNHGGVVLNEVARGQSMLVTRDGEPVATLQAVPRRGLSAAELVARRKSLPRMDPALLRSDLDEALDTSL